jgi:phage shock protein A
MVFERAWRAALTCAGGLGCAALLAGPAVAAGMKAQVVGTPYAASAARSAVPVLFSAQSARRNHLRSQVGVIVVARRTTLPSPDGGVLPGRLRLGDRLVLTATVPKRVRRATYVRLDARKVRVVRRSTQLSTAELADLLAATRAQLLALSTRVDALDASTNARLTALESALGALRNDLAALRADVASLRTRLDALAAGLDSAAVKLGAQVDQVRLDLQPQVTAVTSQATALAGLLGDCSTPSSVVGRLCGVETAVAAVDTSAVTSLTDRVTQISGALTGTVSLLTGQTLTGDLPATLAAPVASALTTLAGLQTQVDGVASTVSSLNTNVGSLQTSVAGVQSQLGAVDATALSSQVSNLITSLGADAAGLNPTAVSTLQGQVTTLQTSLAGVQSQLGSVNVTTLNSTVSTIQTQLGSAQTSITSLCNAVNGQALPVLGSLPGIGSVAGMLTATLTDAC